VTGREILEPEDRGPSESADSAPDRDGIAGRDAPLLSRNIKLTVEYEGTRYNGWQRQDDHPTVQGELESAVSRIVDHPVVLYGSGRTDRGVHALGQVANFKTSKGIPAPKLLLGINTYLPDDIRVRSVEEVPPEFHARYSAKGKRYRYTFYRSHVERVMIRRYCEVIRIPLDLERMRRAAALIRGMRDYKALEGNAKRRAPAPGEAPRSTVRTVLAVTVQESGPFIFIDAFGRGFLYGMVRTIAGTLHEVGEGKRRPEEIEEVLDSLDRRRAGFTAAARGLCLISVYYQGGALEEAIKAVELEEETTKGSDPDGKEHEETLKLFS
jgi:tRNA pseudouridine38-40 synthase